MEKPERNKQKKNREKENMKWVQTPTPLEERVSASGVTFRGKWVNKK